MVEYIKRYLKISDVEYKKEESFKKISPVKIGGVASIVAYPRCEKELVELVSFLRDIGCKYRLLGRMSNVLPPDEKYDGVIIKTDKMRSAEVFGEYVMCDAGVALPHLAAIAREAALSGLEELAGIPGSVGGAAVGNAGAFGREVSDVFVSARCYFPKDDFACVLHANDVSFDYRKSDLQKSDCLVLSCVFRLKTSNTTIVKTRMDEFRRLRNMSQPTGYPSLGSTFKRPCVGCSAGKLIDECGLKGFAIGGAIISEKHAGFIVNAGNASASDYIKLSEYAAACVKSKFGICLQREIEIMQ